MIIIAVKLQIVKKNRKKRSIFRMILSEIMRRQCAPFADRLFC